MQRLITELFLRVYPAVCNFAPCGKGLLLVVHRAVTLLVSVSLLAGGMVIAYSRPNTPGAGRSARRAANPSGVAQRENEGMRLESGKTTVREIAGGETHFYPVNLRQGEFLRAVVDQRGIDVVVTLYEPGGERALVVDMLFFYGPEPVSCEAEKSGTYRLEVRPSSPAAVAGRYTLVSEIRPSATRQDRERLAAERLLARADELEQSETTESLRGLFERGQKALTLWRGLSDKYWEAYTLNRLGLFHISLIEPQNALESYNQALTLRRAIGDRRGEAATLGNIGNLLDILGEPHKALDCFSQALPIARAVGDRNHESAMQNNIGSIYASLGEPQKALESYNQALSLRGVLGNRRAEAATLINIGVVYYFLGEHKKALEFYNQALPLTRTVGDSQLEAYSLRSIGLVHSSQVEQRNALDFYNRALMLDKNPIGKAITLNHIGSTYNALGEPQKALEFHNQALSLVRVVGYRKGEANTRYWIARSERDRGNLSEARKQIEAALDIIESLRAKLARHDLRSSYFATAQGSYEFYTDLLTRLHKRDPSAGYDAAALQVTERKRARSLVETLAEARADIRQGVNPTLIERERSLQQQLNIRAQLQAMLLSGPHTTEQMKAAAEEVEALTTELQQVDAQIRRTSPRYAALTQPQPLALAEMQSLLDPDTVLLEYALGTEHSYVWVVTSGALETHELAGRGEIESLARQAYESLTARNRRPKSEPTAARQKRIADADARYWEKAAELSRLILTPVAAHLKDKRLIVVADGALQKIPFGALPSPQTSLVKSPLVAASGLQGDAGAMQTSGRMRPLVADHEIVNLPSASVLASLRRETAGRVPARKAVAVFADPVFDKGDTRVAGKIAQIASRRHPPMPDDSATPTRRDDDLRRALRRTGMADDSLFIARLFASRREAEAITALAPLGSSLMAVDFDASRALATDPQMGQYRIIHFATHALVNYEHPGLSGLILSLVDERGAARDGFLRLHDIFNLRLNADLVVLSACNTGLGKEIGGEGLVGMMRGFMYAGAPRVIASLWKVDDDATASLMQRMYQRILTNRQSPAAALRSAQLEMWQQKHQSAPYFWAAFTLQGEWR